MEKSILLSRPLDTYLPSAISRSWTGKEVVASCQREYHLLKNDSPTASLKLRGCHN